VAVFFSPRAVVTAWREETQTTLPCVVDEGRALYRGLGIKRDVSAVWDIGTVHRYASAAVEGKTLHEPTGGEDLYQMGGDCVVSPDGLVLFLHRSSTPFDRPPLAPVLGAMGRDAKQ